MGPLGFERPAVAFVQGAGGGVGSALTRRLLDHPKIERVFASSRHPAASNVLQELRGRYGERLELLSLDVSDESSIEAAAEAVDRDCGRLDTIFNCSGVLHGETMRPEKRLTQVEAPALRESFEVNALGPLLVSKHLVGLLPRHERSLIVNLSARVGSIGDNRAGGWYAYRASKSALNMFTRCLALELRRSHPGCVCVAIHPGTVDTALSRPFSSNPDRFTPEDAAEKMFAVLEGLGSEDSGRFFAWDGCEIPW